MTMIRNALALCAALGWLSACATASNPDAETASAAPAPPAFASTYVPRASTPTLLRGATVLDGDDHEYASTDVLMADGRIVEIGANLALPAGATEVNAAGKFVTPGIIDVHSHLGAYPSPTIDANQDGNEATDPNTAQVWVEHSIWPMDPGFARAIAGGVTMLHILPGSANLFGGRGVTVRPVLGARTAQEMKVPGAPQSMKMACGENPSRVYGGRNSSPATDMGNVAGYRQAFAEAQAYARKWKKYHDAVEAGETDAEEPDRNYQMETLAGVLDGSILLQWHCYRSDQMAAAIEVSHEFGFRIAAFHHAVEAYKIAPLLARENICAAVWADWWGFKIEAYDGIRENLPFVDAGGACAVIHSDSEIGIQRLNQEVAKALSDGRRAGLEITRAHAWTWLSRNPARVLGLGDRTGTLTAGKAADVVVWSGDPFSTYARAERVYVDGALLYDRARVGPPDSDFELGQTYEEGAR